MNEETLAPYRCPRCNFSYNTKKALTQHLKQNLCDGILDKIRSHKESGEWDQIKFKRKIQYKPTQEIETILSLQNFVLDFKHNENPLTCKFCQSEEKDFQSLEKHISDSHGRRAWLHFRQILCPINLPIACTDCGLCFASEKARLHHLETKHCEFYRLEVEQVGKIKDLKGPFPHILYG